jgi:predicted nuclease with TOPRIM domain
MTEAGGQITTNNQYYKDQIKLINKLKSQLGEVVEETEEVVETVEEANFSDFFDDLSKGITVVIANVKNGLYDIEAEMQKAKDSIVNDVANSISKAFGDMFSMLGKNLVGAGHSFEDFASVALNALSEVLKSISAQLSAIAVLKTVTHDYAYAAIALAGATASMVASGVASQVSKNLTTTKKKIDAVGESANKAGKDLEYFINRLKEIQSGFTYSSKNLIQSVNALKVLWEEAQEAESEKYKELRSAWDKLNDTHFYMDYKRVQDLTAEYENLSAETKKLKDEYYSYTKTVIAGESQIIKENAEEVRSYKDIYNSVYRVMELQLDYLKNINSKMATDFIKEQIEFQSQYTKVLILEQMESIQKGVISLYESLSSVGKNIGEKITGSIVNGMDKSSFLQDMKAYFRENIIKFAVYTDEFQTRLAQIGARVGALFSGGFANTFATIDSVLIKDELEAMYDETAETVKGIDKLLDSIFGKTTETIEKELSAFTQLINSFEEQLKDVGGEIGTQFVDAISNGMNQSDFLGKMKDWIKRMLVQSVVYTESMKAEIEAIGQAITKGIREGFTETSLHEIRRDLSWVFNEANETVASLDNILDKTFGGYAIGTNNALSGLHLVGEAGPELVRFRGGEQVLNANNTQKALSGIGGTTINQNVTFNNLQDTTAYAMMNQFKQYNRQMAINGVI